MKASFHVGDTVYHAEWTAKPRICKHCKATNYAKGKWQVRKSTINRIQ